MNKFLMPKDIIAIILVIGIMILKSYGFDGYLDAVFALIVGYYFGHRQSKIDNGI